MALPLHRPFCEYETEDVMKAGQLLKFVTEAQGLDAASDKLTANVRQIRDAVVHHATEEEQEMRPAAKRELVA